METVFLILAFITCIVLFLTIIEFIYGFNKISNLTDQVPIEEAALPSLSIVFSALNEENEIEAALTSLLNLSYPNLEIIAINDRSTDKTSEILERLQKTHSERIRVFHIKDLPPGWLGKNHALYLGSQYAKGEWLLFTDADVLMKKDTLIKSISYALHNKIDHLTILENHLSNCFWLRVFYLGNYVTYSMAFKPWRARYTWSKKFIGHGAFNLVKKISYEQCGGHQAIALECLDDLQLGKLIKRRGFKQDTVDGRDLIEREWYKSLPDVIKGLEKNAFAVYEYRLLPVINVIIFAFFFYLWPLVGMIVLTGTARWLNVLNVYLTLLMCVYVAKQFRLEKYFALFYPAAIVILLYAMLNSVFSIYKNNGVIWRGTYYSLKQLKNKNL